MQENQASGDQVSNQTGARIQRVDILELTWLGTVKKLSSLYSKESGINSRDIDVFGAADPDDAEYLQQQKGAPLELPYIVISPMQVEPNTGSYNAPVMRKHGYPMAISDDRSNWTVAKLAPVLMTLRVTMVTDDVITMMRMIGRWTSNEIWTFDIKQANWGARIQSQADKTIQIPSRVPNAGGSRQFKLETSLRVQSYSGTVVYVPAIRKIELATLMPNAATIADALDDPASDAIIVNVQNIDANPPSSPVVYEEV